MNARSPKISHRQAFQLIQAAMDGRLDPQAQADLDRHLARCPDCQASLALHQQLASGAPASRHHAAPAYPGTGAALTTVQSRVRTQQRLRRLVRGAQPVAWVGLAILLVLSIGWVFNRLTPQPAAPPPAGEKTPSWLIERPRPLRVDELAMDAVQAAQGQMDFDLRVPTNLPMGWKFIHSQVDPLHQTFSLQFQRESAEVGTVDSLQINQQFVGPDPHDLSEIVASFIPPEAEAEAARVGDRQGLYLQGESHPGGWDRDLPVWRIVWLQDGSLYEVQQQGSLVGKSILIKIGQGLRTLKEIEASDYLQVLEVTPQRKNIELAAAFGGIPGLVAIQGRHAYLAEGASLAVLDVGDPANITLLGRLPLPDRPGAIQVAGGHAYVAAGKGGLWVLDLSDPGHPTRVGALRLAQLYQPISVQDVAVVGDQAYVAWQSDQIHTSSTGTYGKSGLQVLDVSDPADPLLAGLYVSNRPAQHIQVAVWGETAYLTTGVCEQEKCAGVLAVIDVSDPANPCEVGSNPEIGFIQDVAAAEGNVYVSWMDCSARGPFGSCLGGLTRLDADGFGEPVIYQQPGQAGQLVLSADRAYLTYDDRLRVVDLSDPVALTGTGTYITRLGVSGLAISGERVYLHGWQTGLQVLDVADPRSPRLLGEYPAALYAMNVETLGASALIRDLVTQSTLLWDFANPASPRQIAALDYQTDGMATLAVSGKMGYIYKITVDCVNSGGVCASRLEVVDFSNPAAAVTLGELELPAPEGSYITQVAVSGDILYLLEDEGIWLVDVSNPAAPTLLAHEPFDGLYTTSLAPAGNLVFVVGLNGLRVLDVTDPAHPVRVRPTYRSGTSYNPGAVFDAQGVAAVGETVYVSTGSGLWRLASRNPLQLEQIKSYSTRTGLGILRAFDQRLILGADEGLLILDTADPADPQVVGAYEPLAQVIDLATAGDLIYAVDEWGGFSVLRFTPPVSTTPES